MGCSFLVESSLSVQALVQWVFILVKWVFAPVCGLSVPSHVLPFRPNSSQMGFHSRQKWVFAPVPGCFRFSLVFSCKFSSQTGPSQKSLLFRPSLFHILVGSRYPVTKGFNHSQSGGLGRFLLLLHLPFEKGPSPNLRSLVQGASWWFGVLSSSSQRSRVS